MVKLILSISKKWKMDHKNWSQDVKVVSFSTSMSYSREHSVKSKLFGLQELKETFKESANLLMEAKL